jgi:hypothetical protein
MRRSHNTQVQSTASHYRLTSPNGRVTVHGCTVRSPLTGCQITSRPRDRYSKYSKWLYTFRTNHVVTFYYKQPKEKINVSIFMTKLTSRRALWVSFGKASLKKDRSRVCKSHLASTNYEDRNLLFPDSLTPTSTSHYILSLRYRF